MESKLSAEKLTFEEKKSLAIRYILEMSEEDVDKIMIELQRFGIV